MRCFARALVPSPAVVGSLAPWLGALLALPAVGKARVLDDHVLELLARGGNAHVAEPLGSDLFQFASGTPSDNLRLMARGSLLPWWSDPELKITFFRPLSSLLHRLDYALWAERSELMYVHSLLWLVLLLVLIHALYARFEATAGSATLATWLYALNDANGPVVSWLSNRNALVSGVGVVATLIWHRRAREGHRPSGLLAPAAFAFASFAGELGLSAWAFLAAHALVLERGPLARRCAALWPYALVTLLWAGAYLASGAGTRGSGVYLHPLVDPAAFARALPERAVVLLGAAFGPLPADLAFIGSGALLPIALGVGLACLAALAWVARAVLRHDRLLAFWWTATLLSVLPVAASFPSDRLLLVINIGAMAIVARVLRACWCRRSTTPAGALVVGAALLLVHGVLAALLLPWRANQMQQLAAASERAFACLDDIEDLERRTLVVLGGPADLFVSYLQVERAARGLAQPERVYWVTNPGAALHVRAADERTLELEREGGFFTAPPEALYRGRRARLEPGQRVVLPELQARIDTVDASGAPLRITLRLAQPLAAERYVFLELRGAAYRPVAASELGARRIAPAPGLIELLASVHPLPLIAQTPRE